MPRCAYDRAYRLVSGSCKSLRFVATWDVVGCSHFPFLAASWTTFESACGGSTPPEPSPGRQSRAVLVDEAGRGQTLERHPERHVQAEPCAEYLAGSSVMILVSHAREGFVLGWT
jgi:hypothetical protein